MTIKTLLFSLFLYVCLVWVGAAYYYNGPDIVQVGLLWTGIGLIAVLAYIIISRIIGWWRLWRAKAASRPSAAPGKPTSPAQVHEDDASLAALIDEARAALAKAPGYVPQRGTTALSGRALYLLVGPEGSGKTSTFVNSGLEPQLLAGQVSGSGPVVPTRLCNIWLAKNAIFVEISGRAFSGDLARWSHLLSVLRGTASAGSWRTLWSEPQPELILRGVVGFCDVKAFSGAATAQLLERFGRDWQERLRAIGEVFGIEFPVYQVIAKADSIQFFADFFRHLPESEASQVVGCTLPLRGSGSARRDDGVEDETKRLTRSFRPLNNALARRRLTHLAHEPNLALRPAIYEFPRELKRIRSPLIQFLTDAFRPHPLRPGPLLRGYYLTGIREVEIAAPDLGESRADWSGPKRGLDATRLFSQEATQIFRSGDIRQPNAVRTGNFGMRWIFVADLFNNVVLVDHATQKAVPVNARLSLQRQLAFGAVCAVCALLSFAFIWSWFGNRQLLQEFERAANGNVPKRGKQAMLADLRGLEALRSQVAKLMDYDRHGAPWSLRWGLYAGNRVLPAAREAYFRRFQQLLLNDLNGTLVARLQGLPAVPGPTDPYDPAYRALKTHLMISSGSCSPETPFVSQVLKETRDGIAPNAGPEERTLAAAQIDFYAGELPHDNPCHVQEQSAARDHAREYLRHMKGGDDQVYRNILASVEKTLAKPQRLADLAENYSQVLRGPGELSPAFSPQGWELVQKLSKQGTGTSLADACVMGGVSGVVTERIASAESALAIQRMYVADYIKQWRNYVAAFSVARYNGPEDAAAKLDILAGHKSPLLALFAMTSRQTNFPETSDLGGITQKAIEKVPVLSKVFGARKKAEKAVDGVANAGADRSMSTPADITRSFQPVQWVVPPASETWVGERTNAYVEALSLLRHSMQEIARGGSSPDPAVHQAAGQNYEKALDAARQIEKGFKPIDVEGLDTAVQRLLEEPIRLSKGFIIGDMDKAASGKANGELHAFCEKLKITLRKYPFQASTEDASLEEFASWFAPGSGAIWKFQAQALAELTVKDAGQWKSKDPAKKPQVTPEMLNFLNRAQAITDAFYPAGATQLQLTYTLRPKLDPSFANSTLELEVDGKAHQWTSLLQKQFVWPAPPGTKDPGAKARIRTGSVDFAFTSQGGPWGIFRVMADAEPRPPMGKLVEWKYTRGSSGRLEPIRPAPVRMEIVEFPGGVDVFSPKFFDGLQCPKAAAQ